MEYLQPKVGEVAQVVRTINELITELKKFSEQLDETTAKANALSKRIGEIEWRLGMKR